VSVGASVGNGDGSVGPVVGASEGCGVGSGLVVGSGVGTRVGSGVGRCVGIDDGVCVGAGDTLGAGDGSPSVGFLVATMVGLWLGEGVGTPMAEVPGADSTTASIASAATRHGTPRLSCGARVIMASLMVFNGGSGRASDFPPCTHPLPANQLRPRLVEVFNYSGFPPT